MSGAIKILWVGVPLMVAMPFQRRYMLDRDLEVNWMTEGEKAKQVIIPRGFVTDGASIPRAFWSIIGSPYLPEFITGAIVHDWMCEQNWEVNEMSDLFLALLIDSNVDSRKAEIMRASVYLYKSHF